MQRNSRLSPLRGTEQLGVAEKRINGYIIRELEANNYNNLHLAVKRTIALFRRARLDPAWETG